jgi:hypothetical protein
MSDITIEQVRADKGAAEENVFERLARRLSEMADADNDFGGRERTDLVANPGVSIFGAMANRIVANGWSVFPQVAIGDRRAPGRVDGETIKWKEKYDLENKLPVFATLKRWVSQCRDHNIALVCGLASADVFALDIDVMDPAWNARIMDLAFAILGPTPFRRVGKAPKIVLLYRWHKFFGEERPPAKRAFRFDDGGVASSDGIEILSRGSPVTIFGRHHTTGRDFRWLGPSPFDSPPTDLPEVSPDTMKKFIDAVNEMRPFYSGSSFEGSDVAWEVDPNSELVIPKLRRSSGAAVPWSEDATGRVYDGRDAYLNRLVLFAVSNNRNFIGSDEGKRQIKGMILDQFVATAETTGRWAGEKLRREVDARVERTINRIKSGDLKATQHQIRKSADGKVLRDVTVVAPRPVPVAGNDSLSFLPPVKATAGEMLAGPVRTPVKIHLHPNSEDPAEVERRRVSRAIVTDRTHEAKRTSSTIDVAVAAYLDDVYAPLEERRNVIHLLKTPTGSGKTSRTFRIVALDERTRESYQLVGKDGPETGRFPFLFMLPTYDNIGELRNRANVLNLDPELTDEQFAEAAEELGLLPIDRIEARLGELRREAANAGLIAMTYKGKVAAGCRMADKLKMAMEAGISTSGFCRAEVQAENAAPGEKDVRYCPYHPDINTIEPCPAILQRKQIQQSHVVFLPHAFMALTVPEELQKVRGVIADERIHSLFLHVAKFPLCTLDNPRPAPKLTKKERKAGTDAQEFLADREILGGWTAAALDAGRDPAREILNRCREAQRAKRTKDWIGAGNLAALRMLANAKRCCAGSWDVGRLITPDLGLDELREICDTPTGINIREEHRFWTILLDGVEKLIKGGITEDLAREIGRLATAPVPDMRVQLLRPSDDRVGLQGQKMIRISWRTEPNWPDRPLLLLDASAAPEIVCKVLGRRMEDLRLTPLETSMNIQTVAVIDRSYATSSLVPASDLDRTEAKAKFDAARLVSNVRQLVSLLSSVYGWSRVVAGTTMAVRRVIGTGWKCPGNIDWVHFGALRGLDFAKYHAAAVSIGRLEPPVWAIDGICAALTYDDQEPEPPFDAAGTGRDAEGKDLRLPQISTVVRMRSGHDYLLDVPGFPELTEARRKQLGRDSWHRILHAQFREEEQSQFLGRLRPVYREGETPVWFCVARVIPEGVIVDDLVALDDFIGDARCAPSLWETARRTGGFLHPLIARDPNVAMDLYASEEAVRRDMRKVGLDDATGKVASRYAWGFDVYSVEMALWDGATQRWDDTAAAEATFVYVLADVGRGKEVEERVGAMMDGAAQAAARESGMIEGCFLRPRLVALSSECRPRDPRVARRAPDKIELELGSPEERAAVEEEMLDQAAATALRFLRREDAGARDGWYRGLRRPGEGGDLMVPLQVPLAGPDWDYTVHDRNATLRERVAKEAIVRVKTKVVQSEPRRERAPTLAKPAATMEIVGLPPPAPFDDAMAEEGFE